MKFAAFVLFAVVSTLTAAATNLDLSWRGLTKEAFFRDSNGSVTSQVEKATELNLRGNFFDSFVDCAGKLDKLEVLDLSMNNLTRFYFACNEQDNLYKLNVSHNRLPFLNDSSLSKHVSKLEILDLSFNVIQFLKKTTFQHLENLKFLSISGNPIKTNIERGIFENLTSLTALDMSNISAHEFPNDLFITLINLRHISLSSNPLQEIPALPTSLISLDVSETNLFHLTEMDFPRLTNLKMNRLPLLEYVDLSRLEKVRSLNTLSFESCPRLKKITAEGNIGDLLPLIKSVSIRNCSVDKFGPDVLSVMQKTADLDLQDNPWQCDCALNWISSVNSTNNYHDHMRCGSPERLKGKRVFEIPKEELECSNMNYLALFLALGVISVSAILIALSYFARESILRQWRGNYKRGDTVSYKYITKKSNDGEKILDQCDSADYA